MNAKKLGVQLSAQKQKEIFGDTWLGEEYAEEAYERWSETDQWKQSQKRAAQYSEDDWRGIKADTDALEARVAQAMSSGIEPGTPAANELAQAHRAQIEAFYDCSYQMHTCLADMYVADPRFTAHYDAVKPGLARYLHDVIHANAAQHAD